MLLGLEQEATAEAVRLGHPCVAPLHLLLAVLMHEEQMLRTGLRPVPAQTSAVGFLLYDFGVDQRSVLPAVEAAKPEGPLAGPQRRRAWRTKAGDPPWTAAAVRIAEQAREIAAENSTEAGSLHLLHALLIDPEDDGRQVLGGLSVDVPAVLAESTRRLAETGRAR